MNVKIYGCPEKAFKPYVERSVQFFADLLISKKMQENVGIKIRFVKKLDVYGYAEVDGHNASRKPRKFIITVHSGLGARPTIETIAHEMVHVRQFVYGHINETLDKWYDLKEDFNEVDYWFKPWEIEAHGLEAGLMTKFAISENLWEIFGDFVNPAEKIKKVEINWLKPPF
jgi:hypothetical protein